MTDLSIMRGVPAHISSKNDPESTAKGISAEAAYIEPAALLKNGYCETFNGRFRDELLNR